MRGTGHTAWCCAVSQPKCISKRRKYCSSWYCIKNSFKDQTCMEDRRKDMADTGEEEWSRGKLTVLLKWGILAVLKSLGSLPLTVMEPGFTPMHWIMGILKQDEVSSSPPQSSCKSRPEGTATGSHMQNLARSARRWPAFLYRRRSSTLFLTKSKDSYSSKSSVFFSENTRYCRSSSPSLWNTQIQFSDTSQMGPPETNASSAKAHV